MSVSETYVDRSIALYLRRWSSHEFRRLFYYAGEKGKVLIMDNLTDPKVSVIIPVYNGSNYVAAAIDSVLAQTYKNIEILVVNDGSTDGGKTEKVAKSYGNKIKYFLKENGKVASTLNYGIKKMTGEYFSWLSHDDIFYPEKTAKEIEYISSHPKIKIVYEDYDYIDSDGKKIGQVRSGKVKPNQLLYRLFTGSPVNGCNLLIHKSCFDKVGLFIENLRTTQDYDLWFKMALEFEMVHLSFASGANRLHNLRDTRTLSDLCYKETNKLFIDYLQQIDPARLLKSSGQQKYHRMLLGLAINFCQRNFMAAGDFAYKQSIENWRESQKYDLRFDMLAIYYLIVRFAYKTVRFIKRTISRLIKRTK